jgi:hypothetical protein
LFCFIFISLLSFLLIIVFFFPRQTEVYDGLVFVYEQNSGGRWERSATITSPFAQGGFMPRALSQGFGYRVDISNNYLIASTSVNNGKNCFCILDLPVSAELTDFVLLP